MENTDLVVLDTPEDDDYSDNDLTTDQVEKIIELLGYSPTEARKLLTNTPALVSSRYINEELSKAFKASRIDDIAKILKPLKFEFIKIDDCHLLRLYQINEAPFSEDRLNWFRRKIGPYYPDKIRGHTIAVSGPDGKQILLQTWDLAEARQFDQIFEQYYQWINQQKNCIGPKFEEIKTELGDWLLKKLNIEGISPQKDGFVAWFISNKLSLLELSFSITTEKHRELSTQGHFQRVRLKIKNLTKYLTTEVIVAHLVEYFLWLEQKGLDGIFQGKVTHQNNLSERALIHQPKIENIYNNQPKDKLTQRERALIHCYKQLAPIKKGEPLYDDYIAFANPRKRISYPNDSKRRADLLIISIEKVLPHLTEIERQQAEREIKTISANFSN